MDRKPLFGVWIQTPTIHYFISDPKQALPEHSRVAQLAWKTANRAKRVLVDEPTLKITAARIYADVAPYVILQDINPQEHDLGIFQTKWTPESSTPLEVDYRGRNRFKVLDFAVNAAEAVAIVKTLTRRGK